MTSSARVSGAYKETAPYVKIGESWKFSKEAWSKVGGDWKTFFLAGGVNDSSFNTADNYGGVDNLINSVAVQSDGKILIGGQFTKFNSVNVNRFVRLNADGTLDTNFMANLGTAFNNNVFTLAIQPDNKLVIGGAFTNFNGAAITRILRLNSDGTLDTAFTTNTGTGFNLGPQDIAIQSDGKIVIGGNFATLNGATVNFIARLNADGTPDTAFTTNTGTGASTIVEQVKIQSDGKIVLGGQFTTFNGVTVNRIVRLNTDGTRDTAFTTNTGTACNGAVNGVAIQSDGKILLVGNFSLFNTVTVNRIVRLNTNGTRDTAFTTNTGTGMNLVAESIAIQSDGKIVIGGGFSTFNTVTVNRIVRLNTDGTRDTAFTTNTGSGANGSINAIAIQSDGKIILTGAFGFTIFNGRLVGRFVRLNADGTRDTDIGTVLGFTGAVYAIAIQSDGKIVVGGAFTTFNGVTVNCIVRLNADGTRDTAFTTNTGTAANGSINAIAIQSDGKILVGGAFTTFNSTTVNRIVRLNTDGTLDTAFTTNTGTGFNSTVFSLAIQSDGKIVAVGAFLTFNSVSITGITRLNSNGTVDATFPTGTNFNITGGFGPLAVKIQSDGKIVVGGIFTSYRGTTRNRVARLNTDGTLDTSFTPDLNSISQRGINAIAIQSDGKIICLGGFTIASGVTVNGIARLNTNGTLDTAFATNTGTGWNTSITPMTPFGAAIQSDGKILLGAGYEGEANFVTFNGVTVNRVLRLNSNGTRDTDFTTNINVGANDIIHLIEVESGGKILIGGNFTYLGGNVRNRLARVGGDLTA
jgi:uncharacterized delta-60 repeat protein